MSLLLTLCLMIAPPSASELVERSIRYHDPNDRWREGEIELVATVKLAPRLAQERGYATRSDRLRFNLAEENFSVVSDRGKHKLAIALAAGRYSATLDGKSDFSPEQAAEFGLTTDRLPRWHHYFEYMFGLPMKLADPGTRIDPEVKRVTFDGDEVWAVRVTYDPEVGSDLWDFYFDPESAELVGCRFFHDEEANDGEFIAFDEVIVGSGGLKLPKIRRWHMNLDGEWIADDRIESLD